MGAGVILGRMYAIELLLLFASFVNRRVLMC